MIRREGVFKKTTDYYWAFVNKIDFTKTKSVVVEAEAEACISAISLVIQGEG